MMSRTPGDRRSRILLAAVTAISVSACAGLRQFPEHPASYGAALQEQDPEYATGTQQAFSKEALFDRIKAYLRPPNGAATSPMDPAAVAAVRRWIDASDVADLPIAVLLNDKHLEGLRASMIKDLRIQ